MEYAALGWKVLPTYGIVGRGACECHLRAECPSPGKHPRITEWQLKASSDEEVIANWWQDWPQSNVGVQLGPRSGIIDIEFDDDEGRATAERLIGDAMTPTFSSARSVHRIFQFDPSFPVSQAAWKYNGLEFRIGANAKGSQTIFPPSTHHTEVQYRWEPGLSPSELQTVAPIPPAVIAMIDVIAGRGKAGTAPVKGMQWLDEIWDGVGEGERDNTLTSMCGQFLRAAEDPMSDFTQGFLRKHLQEFNQKCKPPLGRKDITSLIMRITTAEVARRERVEEERWEAASGLKPTIPAPNTTVVEGDGGDEALVEEEQEVTEQELAEAQAYREYHDLGLRRQSGEWFEGSWRCEVTTGEVSEARLFAPFINGCVIIPLNKFDDAAEVHRAVLAVTGVHLERYPGAFKIVWKGTPDTKDRGGRTGVAHKLMQKAHRRRGAAELHTEYTLALLTVDVLNRARLLNGASTDRRESWIPDDEQGIVFSFAALMVEANFQRLDVKRNAMSAFLKSAGVVVRVIGSGKARRTLKYASNAVMDTIRSYLYEDDDEVEAEPVPVEVNDA